MFGPIGLNHGINFNNMKELNRFREFLSEGKMDKFKVGQTVKYKADGKEKEGEIEKIDGIYLKLKSGGSIPYQSVLENALANDKGDGTFEITADIDIMGKKFNFSDICPGAHKAIANLAKEYANNDDMLGDLLYLAQLHQTFFNLEKKALGPQGIDADDLNNIKELYVDINNIANNAFGEEAGKEVKTYMNMHMDKIKEAGLKASEPGGSSDMNFSAEEKANVFVREEGLEENDKALDEILDEEINEVSKAESNVYALLKEIKMEIDKVLNEEGKAKALDVVDMSIDYLKSLDHKIVTRG